MKTRETFHAYHKNLWIAHFKFASVIAPNFSNHKTFFILNFLQSFEKIFDVSSFMASKDTQVNLEKSSTTRKAYLFPSSLLVHLGPNKSMSNNSKGLTEQMLVLYLKELLFGFLFDKHRKHYLFQISCWIIQQPFRDLKVFFNKSMFARPRRLCHSQLSFSKKKKH